MPHPLSAHLNRVMLLCLVLASCGVLGCGNSQPSISEFNNSNIRRTRSAYGIFVWLNKFKAPKSEEEFKEFLKTDLAAERRLGRIGVQVEDVDSIFISERDGQPFTIRYGINGRGDKPIVFETEGVEGKRMVAFWEPIEVEEGRYQDLLAGKEDRKKDAEAKAESNDG